MEKELQELLDRKACEDVLMRYGRTLDWLDEAGQEECFWPDADVDYGFFEGAGKDWVPVVLEVEKASPRRWHVSTGIMVKVDGNTAKAESYGLAVGTSEDESGALVDTMFGGRYLDELEKREGQWRISKRLYIADWIQQFPNGMDALASGDMNLHILNILCREAHCVDRCLIVDEADGPHVRVDGARLLESESQFAHVALTDGVSPGLVARVRSVHLRLQLELANEVPAEECGRFRRLPTPHMPTTSGTSSIWRQDSSPESSSQVTMAQGRPPKGSGQSPKRESPIRRSKPSARVDPVVGRSRSRRPPRVLPRCYCALRKWSPEATTTTTRG